MPRAPLVAPNVDALLVVDTAYLPSLLHLLDHARERVDVLAYSFPIPKRDPASAPLQIANKLLEVQARGVTVRVFLEGRRETAERNRPTGDLLAKGGIAVMYGSTHAKGVRVDRAVLFGSTNFSNQSLTKNIETNLFFDDDAVAAGFERYFEHLSHGGGHGGVTLDPPMLADGDFAPGLIDMIDAARERIDFSIYFFDQVGLRDALLRAHARGVAVRGLVHTHASFAMSYVRRTHATVARLRTGGIADLHFGPAHLFTHSKFLVRDREEIMLGTGNWLDEDVEIHPQLYVRITNAKIGRELVTHLGATIESRGTRVA